MAKKKVATLILEKGWVNVTVLGQTYEKQEVEKPPGCLGFLYVFESKKAAKEYYKHRKVKAVEIEFEKK